MRRFLVLILLSQQQTTQSKFHENELRYKPPCLKFVTIKKSVIKPYWEEEKIMSDIFQNMSDIIFENTNTSIHRNTQSFHFLVLINIIP